MAAETTDANKMVIKIPVSEQKISKQPEVLQQKAQSIAGEKNKMKLNLEKRNSEKLNMVTSS